MESQTRLIDAVPVDLPAAADRGSISYRLRGDALMRRLSIVSIATLALACSGDGKAPPRDNFAAVDQAIAEFAAMGIRCVHREPPPFHACDGLANGAACVVSDEGESGVCKLLRDGRLVCAEVENDKCAHDDNDEGEDHGGKRCDGGVPLPTDGGVPTDGGLPTDGRLAIGGGPASDAGLSISGGDPLSPFEAAVDACANHGANDACSFGFHEQQIEGNCRNVPGLGVLLCAPACSHH